MTEPRPEPTPPPFNDAPLLEAYDRLLAAVAYCRKRLRQPGYEAALDGILAGHGAQPDHTPMTGGKHEQS